MFLLVTTINYCFWCFLIILMFVIKSNNSEKKSLSNRDFFISKKYNKRRILTSNRKRDREFHLKKYLF